MSAISEKVGKVFNEAGTALSRSDSNISSCSSDSSSSSISTCSNGSIDDSSECDKSNVAAGNKKGLVLGAAIAAVATATVGTIVGFKYCCPSKKAAVEQTGNAQDGGDNAATLKAHLTSDGNHVKNVADGNRKRASSNPGEAEIEELNHGEEQFQQVTHGEEQFQQVTHGEEQFQQVTHGEEQFQQVIHGEEQFQQVTHGEEQFQQVTHGEAQSQPVRTSERKQSQQVTSERKQLQIATLKARDVDPKSEEFLQIYKMVTGHYGMALYMLQKPQADWLQTELRKGLEECGRLKNIEVSIGDFVKLFTNLYRSAFGNENLPLYSLVDHEVFYEGHDAHKKHLSEGTYNPAPPAPYQLDNDDNVPSAMVAVLRDLDNNKVSVKELIPNHIDKHAYIWQDIAKVGEEIASGRAATGGKQE